MNTIQDRVTAIGLTPKNTNGMEYRHVGRSGLIASAIGVGCFPFGGFVSVDDSCAVVEQALALGINYFDTANSYGIGKSEEALASRCRASAGRRSSPPSSATAP